MASAARAFKSHSFRKGERVTIFARTMGGRFVIEGTGTIVKPVEGVDHYYIVAFPDGRYQRFVDPDGQENPQAYVDKLNRVPAP